MKKLVVLLTIAAVAVVSQGASLKWGYSSTVNEKNAHIYAVVGSTLPTEISDFSTWLAGQTVVSDATVSYSTLTKKSSASATTSSEEITKDKTYYFVMVDAAGENFKAIGTYAGTDIVYDPANQESAINTATGDAFAAASWKAFGGGSSGGDVPEPTSGLLLALGGAMLALRRRRA